jgi:hypothetical protein
MVSLLEVPASVSLAEVPLMYATSLFPRSAAEDEVGFVAAAGTPFPPTIKC